MPKQAFYHVPVPELEMILPILVLNKTGERLMFETLQKKIVSDNKPFSVKQYQRHVVSSLIPDREAFAKFLDISDDDNIDEEIACAYRGIVDTLYPNFSIEYMCSDYNIGVMAKLLHMDKASLRNHLFGTGEISPTKAAKAGKLRLETKAQLDALRDTYSDRIIGQEEPVEAVCNALKLLATGMASNASFFFVGPTGVGKTEIAKILGENYSGNFFKINCAEYAQGHEYAKLIGSPPGYIGHSEKSLLAEKAEISNRWVFLFDEIEKAHSKLYDFLLSLLDDGTCTDNMGQVLDFSNSIFIFTSNKGVDLLEPGDVGFGAMNELDEESERKITDVTIKSALKGHFSPEFLNRIDDVVVFNHLTKKDAEEIVRLRLEDLPIKVTKPLINYVVEHGYSKEYGARNIDRFIKTHVLSKISDEILEERYPEGDGDYQPRIINNEVKIVGAKKVSQVSA